jgi:hypothetical protein
MNFLLKIIVYNKSETGDSLLLNERVSVSVKEESSL